ncbi:MAG: amidase [bacterium]|nr:amidase [bacterium]
MASTPSPFRSRRAFLAGMGALPAAAMVSSRPPGDAEDMAAAGRLSGLEFTPEQLEQAKRRLQRLRGNYESLRRQSPPFELSPCVHFDPWPVGAERPTPTGRVPFSIRRDVERQTTASDLAFATIDELASHLRQGHVTSVELTKLALARLEQFDPQLFCVVNLVREPALRSAAAMDEELAAGKDRGPLHGIPYGAKDLFGWPGTKTTFGAAPFAEHEWNVRSTVLQKLEDAGAVLVAKLSLGALAMGDVWHGGKTRNPFDPERGSSGSSAGPCSAVAAGLVPFAIGTETLGSIVSPCRASGIAGLRPTFGNVSRYGAMPLSWTMDKVGPIARSAIDAALVFDAIRGRDGQDPAARDTAFSWRRGRDLKRLRVGMVKQRGFPGRDEDRAFVDWLKQKDLEPEPVELPNAPYRSMLTMLDAEAAAAFDEFLRNGGADDLPGQSAGDWPNIFRAARTIPAVEYVQAARARAHLVEDMANALADIDVLVAPTHRGATLVATNLTGHPTYVLPVGKDAERGGRPTMLALVGQLDGEADVLSLAEAWQEETTWHRARPALTR